MKKALHNFAQLIDRTVEGIGKLISWLSLGMVITMFAIVVLRYIFNEGSIAAQESVTYMHATLFMLGTAYALQQDSHVRVDIFYSKMSARKKNVVNIFGILFLLLPTCIFILWSSWEYVFDSWQLKESSREAGGLPWLYVLKTTIVFMCILLILQAIAILIKSILHINTPPGSHNTQVEQ